MTGAENIVVSLVLALTPFASVGRSEVADPTDVDRSAISQAPATAFSAGFLRYDWAQKAAQLYLSTTSRLPGRQRSGGNIELWPRSKRKQVRDWQSADSASALGSIPRQYAIYVEERLSLETRKRLGYAPMTANRVLSSAHGFSGKTHMSSARGGKGLILRACQILLPLRKNGKSGNARFSMRIQRKKQDATSVVGRIDEDEGMDQ